MCFLILSANVSCGCKMSSETFYNKLDLIPPPLLSFKFCSKNPEVTSQMMNNILYKAISVLQNQSNLHTESATLSRLIYRWKRRMRNDKGFKALEKVNRSLLQYLSLDMLSILETAKEKVFDEYGPSRQIIEWVLVRLQGFSKLFDNTCSRCIEAASYLQWRFQNGHIWSTALIGTAVVSRIWIISIYLLKEACVWYSELKQMLPVLQSSLQPWLPADYTFPESLTAWLDYPDYLIKPQTMSYIFNFMNETNLCEEENQDIVPNSIDFLTNQKVAMVEDMGEAISRKDETDALLNIYERKNEENNDNIVLNNGELNSVSKNVKKKIKPKNTKSFTVLNEESNTIQNEIDHVRRKESKKTRKKKNKTTLVNSSSNDIIDNITSGAKLLKFLKSEMMLRKANRIENSENNCLTRNLDKLQFRMFIRFIKEKLEEIKSTSKKKQHLHNVKEEIKTWLS